MRIGIGGDGDGLPEGLRYVGRWPRQESRSVSDGQGGWLQDCMVKVGQGTWIFLISALGGVGGVLTAWTLPPSVAWWILTLAYVVAGLAIPGAIMLAVIERREGWYSYVGCAIATALLGWAELKLFDIFFWDWLEAWTNDFFDFSLPVVNGWTLVMGVGAAILVGGILVKQAGLLLGGGAVMLTALGAWLWTCEFERPGTMFYLLLSAFDSAYIYAATGTIKILRHEQSDVYEPYQSESPALEEPEPVVQPHHSFIRQQPWPRGDTEEAPQPRMLMPTIDSRKPKDNRKNSEWVHTELPVNEFCEALGHAAVNGLRFRDMRFVLRCTGRKIGQWDQWCELIEPLVNAKIYDREASIIHPDFDHGGYIDPWEVLEALNLTQYERMIP